MKRLLFIVACVTASLNLFAQANQCPGCAINVACNNPTANFPALCPAVLPDGEAGQAYSEDLTFFMPYIIDAEGFTGLHLEELTILSISGIPSGLFWTTNHYPTNFYTITSDPNTQHGCAKICGTPVLPGTYNASVSVLVKICNIPVVGCTTLTQNLLLPITINAPAGGNAYFTFNPSSGCGSTDVTFAGLLNLGSPQITEYDWDFGNGDSSNVQNPPVQTYSTPGEYHPTLTTNVYNHVFNAMSLNVTGGWWCGDIEELSCGSGNADIKFTLTHGAASYNGAEVSNTINPSWSNLGVILSNLTIGLQFTEVDNVSASDNGGTYVVTVPGAGVYNFSTTAVTSGGGGTNGNFTIVKQLFNAYTATDTVRVYDLPPLPTVVSSSGSFNMCSTSPITLSVYGGYNYQWFKNDTSVIVGATDSSYVVLDPENYPLTETYKVKVTDPVTGCSIFTPNVTVVVNEGIPTMFENVGAYYQNGVLTTNYTYPTYQWLLNGTALVPSGQVRNYTPVVNGTYTLVVTNAFGCSDTSNVVIIADMDINETSAYDQFVSVFPNPSEGIFTLKMDADISGDVNITMLDLSGKTVHSEYVGQVTGAFQKTFDVQHLSAGIYTLNINFNGGTIRKKIIIR